MPPGAGDSAAETMLELYSGLARGHIRGEIARSPATGTPTTFETFAQGVFVPAIGAAA